MLSGRLCAKCHPEKARVMFSLEMADMADVSFSR